MNHTDTGGFTHPAPLGREDGPSHPMQRRWSDGIAGTGHTGTTVWNMSQQWPGLVSTLSEQAMESSNLVLRALDFMVGAGRMRLNEAKALTESLHRLRDTSLRAQQITRLASGRIRHARDCVDLGQVLRTLMAERKDEFEARGVKIRSNIGAVDVLLDPPVAVTLFSTLLDWAMTFSTDISMVLDVPVFPQPARLTVRVATPARESAQKQGSISRGRRLNDGLFWMLLRQIAASANLAVTRSSADGAAILNIEFPKTFISNDGVSSVDLFNDDMLSADSLANAWVLVIAQDPSLRSAAVESLRLAGLPAKGVESSQLAYEVVSEAKPSAVVLAYDAKDETFDVLRDTALGRDGRCPVVEIVQESPSFHTMGFEGFEIAKVGRDELRRELAPTILFELAKLA